MWVNVKNTWRCKVHAQRQVLARTVKNQGAPDFSIRLFDLVIKGCCDLRDKRTVFCILDGRSA